MRNFFAATLVAALLLVGAPHASAARQLSAGTPPETEGPLADAGSNCDRQTARAGGRVVGRAEICVFVFAFDPVAELNPLRDFGVAWVQMTFDATRGFCSERLGVALHAADGVRIEAHAPPGFVRVRRAERQRVTLDVTAGGSALEAASVSQRLTILPSGFEATADETSARLRWRGRSGAKIALVLGAEISWQALSPPEELEVRPESVRLAAC